MSSAVTVETLDERSLNKFSRQNAALGAETTAKLIKMRVLIYGMRGVGIETAKNLALQGVGAITVVDTQPTELKDIGVNFFLFESDVGKPRGETIVPRLHELNEICTVSAASDLDEATVLKHNAVVITQVLPLPQLLSLNEFCRCRGIGFFISLVGGVTTDIFVDHGPDHLISDPSGDRPMQKLISEVKRINENECLVRYDTPEGQLPVSLSTGHYEISEVVGVDGINNAIYAISREYSDPVKTIRIAFQGSTDFQYISGGLLTEKKLPFKSPMDSLTTKLQSPGDCFSEPPTLVSTDLINFGSEVQQHVAFYATLVFYTEKGILPSPNSEEDILSVLHIAKKLLIERKINLEPEELNEDFIKKYAKYIGIESQAMAAFTGGVLAQEVVKCTGKFTPIPGFMHMSCFEALPDEVPTLEDTLPKNSRYDELAAVYGWKFVEQLGNLKYFMVGCGALGCEFMKNFALNGVCCGPQGKLVVTDADRIELSNLTRQFLFREHNVGQPKSKAAGAMAKVMNSNFTVEALEMFVGPKAEDFFNDEFWMNLDGVCNALDNMEARLYVDRACVKYEKPLLESGTMGTSGNIDTICPFKTKTYKDGGNAAEGGGVPMCTLRNFPHLTDHCIEWARDQFELLFTKILKGYEAYLIDPLGFEEKIRVKAESEPGAAYFDIRSLTSFAKLAASPSIGNAAQLSFDIFHYLFRDRILDLQSAFPPNSRVIDEKTKQDKGPFWGDKKRYPTVVAFNPDDSAHTSFILSATCLFSVAVGLIPAKDENDTEWLKEFRTPDWIVGITSSLKPPPYIQAPVNSEGIENAPKLDKAAQLQVVSKLLGELTDLSSNLKLKATPMSFEPADFEKDDDLNFHIEFITSAANLRCDNYSIKRTDFQSCKVIAGKIIAAIATTTAAVCGLVILELFKLVLKKDTDAYMNRAIGLAQYQYTSFTQDPPYKFKSHTEVVIPAQDTIPEEGFDESGKIKEEFKQVVQYRAYPENHSVWDKISVLGSLTLKEFSSWLESEHKLKLVSWDIIIGHNMVLDEEKNEKVKQSVSTPIYPPKIELNYSLLPSLDLSLAQASGAIMRTAAAKPTQQYIALWKEFKAAGAIPHQPTAAVDAITEQTTLKEILERMSKIAEEAETSKKIETRNIPSLTGRKFFIIPGSDAPVCRDTETFDDIDQLCALKIMF